MTFAWEGRAWSDFNALFDPGAIGGQIVAQLARAERTMEPPRGRVQVLVSPRVLDRLLTCFILGIHGRNVARGNSPLAGRLGQPVLAPTLTVVDHPQVDFSPGASEVDGDGIPCSRRVVFEKGVLKEFLYDLDSAGLAGAKPTGHTACQPHWLMVLPGECTSRELLGELKDGLWIESLIGFGQGNLINGDFSANVGLGYRVQNGEVTGRVKNTMVSGNLYECFARNVTPSSDLNYDGRLPFAAVEGVQCTG
jgi:PmbA protein